MSLNLRRLTSRVVIQVSGNANGSNERQRDDAGARLARASAKVNRVDVAAQFPS
jgi:hypothetical protein